MLLSYVTFYININATVKRTVTSAIINTKQDDLFFVVYNDDSISRILCTHTYIYIYAERI